MLDPYYEEKQRRGQQIGGDEREESIRSMQGEAKARPGGKDVRKHVSYLVGRRDEIPDLCKEKPKHAQK